MKHDAVATPVIDAEQFLSKMKPYAERMAVARFAHHKQYGAVEVRDLQQEAYFALLEAWTKYACRARTVAELCRIGNRAIHFHLGNLWLKERNRTDLSSTEDRQARRQAKGRRPCRSSSRVAAVRASRARGPREDGLEAARLVSFVALAERLGRDDEEAPGAPSGDPSALDRLVAGEDMAEAVVKGLASGKTPVRRLAKRILSDGYILPEANNKEGTTVDQNDVMEPESAEIETPKAEKPKRSRAKKVAPKAEVEKPKAAPAAETAKACGAFKKDDVVVYKGGARVRAFDLRPRTHLSVRSTIVCRGRSYLNLVVAGGEHEGKRVALAPQFVELKK